MVTENVTCTKCLSTAPPARVLRGSAIVLVVLVIVGVGMTIRDFAANASHGGSGVTDLLFLSAVYFSPAIGYQLWRGFGRLPTCSRCGSREIVPADSPRAKQLQGVQGEP